MINKGDSLQLERRRLDMDGEASLFPATFSVSKRPTCQQRVKDAKPIFLFFLGCFLFGFLMPPLCIFLGAPLWLITGSNFIVYMMSMVLVGALAGLSIVLIVRYVSRGLLGGDRKKLKLLEERLGSHGSTDVIGDLDALVTENLKLGRPQVAEFYSKQLLVLCEHAHEGEVAAPDLMRSTPCWVNTPSYHKTFNYFVIWLFESRGLLCLSQDHLEYESTRISFRIALSDIVDIGLAHHPWWLKPIPLNYIKITFRENGNLETMHLSPYNFQTDTVFDINKAVQEWYTNLTKALEKVC